MEGRKLYAGIYGRLLNIKIEAGIATDEASEIGRVPQGLPCHRREVGIGFYAARSHRRLWSRTAHLRRD